ncbi:hypothetical protein A2U01_0099983, partial [Trifolium medium]|nr:hypothetical protein [Trifolium medium]
AEEERDEHLLILLAKQVRLAAEVYECLQTNKRTVAPTAIDSNTISVAPPTHRMSQGYQGF